QPGKRPMRQLEAEGGPVHLGIAKGVIVVLRTVVGEPTGSIVPPGVLRIGGIGLTRQPRTRSGERVGNCLEWWLPPLRADGAEARVDVKFSIRALVAEVGPAVVLVLPVIAHR